ncbi:speckle-type POZ protein-like A [Caerostris extrusa]|uniref:Speckle-type POZ protein-like A n=1 Tax=Caerostris extrusa TaxID=172846 RepID=A0AAV4MT94_CAEEX|nr:speckle-type POZ protein-like A [Caerostris extrusa]
MEVPILRAMLHHTYTGTIESLNIESAGDLLVAADKYQLEDLKRVCCNFLKKNVAVKNVLSILNLGHLHDQDLKEHAMNCICRTCDRFADLEETHEWKTMKEEMPHLAMDVLASLVKSK